MPDDVVVVAKDDIVGDAGGPISESNPPRREIITRVCGVLLTFGPAKTTFVSRLAARAERPPVQRVMN